MALIGFAVHEVSIEGLIAAIGSSIAAVLGGWALIVAASNRRKTSAVHEETAETRKEAKEIHEEVRSENGRSLAQSVARLEASFAEHLFYVGMHMRALGSPEEAAKLVEYWRRKMRQEEAEYNKRSKEESP